MENSCGQIQLYDGRTGLSLIENLQIICDLNHLD